MKRNPLYVFKSEAEAGICQIPLNSIIQILHTNDGRVKVIEITSKDGLNCPGSGATIADLLALPDNYNIISDGTSGGELVKKSDTLSGLVGYKLNDASLDDTGPCGNNSIDFSFQQLSIDKDGGAVGEYSFASGRLTKATGRLSTVFGNETIASGDNSLAINESNTASGLNSVASGFNTQADGANAFASGVDTIAHGDYSNSFGIGTLASGHGSMAKGSYTKSLGNWSFSEGYHTEAQSESSHTEGAHTRTITDIYYDAKYSHAEGSNTQTAGLASHAEGISTISQGNGSHAEGHSTLASGLYSHSEGYSTTASGDYSHAQGQETLSEGKNSFASGYRSSAAGENSFASGESTTANSKNSVALGYKTTANGISTFVSGSQNTANGEFSSIFGTNNTTQGTAQSSIVFGDSNQAEKSYSIVGGHNSISTALGALSIGDQVSVSGEYGVAFGRDTEANLPYSMAVGFGTKASVQNSFNCGTYNIGNSGDNNIFEVGIGSNASNRANAFEIDLGGILRVPKMIGSSFDDIDALDGELVASVYMLQAVSDGIYVELKSQLEKITEGGHTGWRILGRDPINYGDIGQGAIDLSYSDTVSISTESLGATGAYSFAVNNKTTASGTNSTALGELTVASGKNSMAGGLSTSTTSLAENAVAFGENSSAQGKNSLTAGLGNTTTGEQSIAFGTSTEANAENALTLGYNTIVSGINSIAAGESTQVSGRSSIAAGLNTTVDANFSIAVGDSNTIENNAINSAIFGAHNTITAPITTVTAFVFGVYNTTASESIILGSENTISQNSRNSSILGSYNNIDAAGAIIIGQTSSISNSASNSVSIGRNNSISQPDVILQGTNLIDNGNSGFQAAGNWNSSVPSSIYEIGSGVNSSHRRNAFRIDNTGLAYLPDSTITKIINSHEDTTIITKAYADRLVGQLQRITEGIKSGYRLRYRDPQDHGNIGKESIDMTYNSGGSLPTDPPADYGAVGDYSTAFGSYTYTFGKYSHVEGFGAQTQGEAAHAEGYCAKAIGDASHAEGTGTIALNESSHAQGKYNVGTATNTIHEIGIGASNVARKNAFAVYTDGRLHAPELTIPKIDDDTDGLSARTLVTKEYLDQWNKGCQCFISYDFTSDASQTDFILSNVTTDLLKIFSDGILVKSNEYQVSIDLVNTKTTVIFDIPREENEDVIIEVCTNIEGEVDFYASAGQTEFIVTGVVFMTAEIHIGGVLSPKNRFTITNDGTDTKVTFNIGLGENDWVNILY